MSSYFKDNDTETESVYKKFIPLNKLFNKSIIGVQTHRDELVVDFNKRDLTSRINSIFNSNELNFLIDKYKIKQSNSWNLQLAVNKVKEFKETEIKKLCYRPFDDRYILQ